GAADTLVDCLGRETPCSLGCAAADGPHCRLFDPSNLTADDLRGTTHGTLVESRFDVEALTIDGMPADARVQSQGAGAPDIAVFRFGDVTLNGITVDGRTATRAFAIVSSGTVTINGS